MVRTPTVRNPGHDVQVLYVADHVTVTDCAFMERTQVCLQTDPACGTPRARE